MDLGAFSVSLPVADISASRAFYEKLGFVVIGGDQEQNWLILRNGACTIGLFQGMFEGVMLTFNPGWDPNGEPLAEFTDVRELQRRLTESGLTPTVAVDETTSGPAHLVLADPDGIAILLDQHV